MSDTNTITVVGRLTKDAQMKYTNSGTAIAEMSLAFSVYNYGKREDEASFVDVALFGKQADAVAKYLTKGQQVAVSGILRQDRWKNQEGENRSKHVIVANNLQLLQRPAGGAETAQERSNDAPRGPEPDDAFPDDIPF